MDLKPASVANVARPDKAPAAEESVSKSSKRLKVTEQESGDDDDPTLYLTWERGEQTARLIQNASLVISQAAAAVARDPDEHEDAAPPPPWAVAMQQDIAKLQIAMANMQARAHNGFVSEGPDVLAVITHHDGQDPPAAYFPRKLTNFHKFSESQTRSLLQFYELSDGGDEVCCRKRLRRQLGLRSMV